MAIRRGLEPLRTEALKEMEELGVPGGISRAELETIANELISP